MYRIFTLYYVSMFSKDGSQTSNLGPKTGGPGCNNICVLWMYICALQYMFGCNIYIYIQLKLYIYILYSIYLYLFKYIYMYVFYWWHPPNHAYLHTYLTPYLNISVWILVVFVPSLHSSIGTPNSWHQRSMQLRWAYSCYACRTKCSCRRHPKTQTDRLFFPWPWPNSSNPNHKKRWATKNTYTTNNKKKVAINKTPQHQKIRFFLLAKSRMLKEKEETKCCNTIVIACMFCHFCMLSNSLGQESSWPRIREHFRIFRKMPESFLWKRIVVCHCFARNRITLPKTNIAPENDGFQ